MAAADSGSGGVRTANRAATALGAALGLALSGIVVAALLFGVAQVAGYFHRNEMRGLFNGLPAQAGASLVRSEERWENLALYWQSEGVLPRVIGHFHSEQTTGAVVTFYKDRLTAAGWQEYREPWSLYPAYRKGAYRIAILFQQAYAQDWVPAGDYQVHVWSYPLLESFLGRELAR